MNKGKYLQKWIGCFLIIGLLSSATHKEYINHADPYTIYLTFDDGPLHGSENIATAITKENIKVNVFVVGQHIQNSPQLKGYFNEYLVNPMIEVGNHSFSHAHNKYQLYYSNANSVYVDFLKCYNEYKLPTKLCRLPGRNMWRTATIKHNDMPSGSAAADLLYQNGFKIIGWDLEWEHDAPTSSPVQTGDDMVYLIETHLKNGTTRVKNHLVLLSHDEMFSKGWEQSELDQLVDKLKATGNFKFEFLSTLPGL